MKRIAWAGNDVHQETVTVSVFVGEEQEPRIEKRIKTDKRGTRKLGRYYRSGELTTIHIPGERGILLRSYSIT